MSGPWNPEWDDSDESPMPSQEPWRGDVHFDEWPEHLAGPEYWLWKKEEGNDDLRQGPGS